LIVGYKGRIRKKKRRRSRVGGVFFTKMPLSCFKSSEERELKKINNKIDKELELERKMRKKEVKILLLGKN